MDKEREELKFTPLSDGLGFHPFSDGLPYAPVTRAPQPSRGGAGATVAGEIRVAPAIVRPVPVTPAPTRTLPTSRPFSTPARVEPAPAPAPHFADEIGVFYPIKRAVAWLIDAGICATLVLAAFTWVLSGSSVRPESLLNANVAGFTALFVLFFSWALIAAQEVAFATTLGKRLFGMSIEGPPGAILMRAVLFVPSLAFAGLGLGWSLFDRRRRCWHDVASGIQPRELARL